jgi:hypothetical protein
MKPPLTHQDGLIFVAGAGPRAERPSADSSGGESYAPELRSSVPVTRASAPTSGATADVHRISPSREMHDLNGSRSKTQHPGA